MTTKQDDVTSPAPFEPFTCLTADVKRQVKNLSLAGLTRIVGEEAAYKSAIALAVRLAVSGEYDAVGKLPSELLTLAADKSLGMEITLSGPSGTAEWRLLVDPDTGKAKRPNPPTFEGRIASLTDDERFCIIPTDAIRELLKNTRSERGAREAFLRRFGGGLKDLEVPPVLDEQEQVEWKNAVATCRQKVGEDVSADTLLAELSRFFKEQAAAKKREVTPTENILKEKQRQLAQLNANEGLAPELLPERERQLKLALAFEQATKDRKDLAELQSQLNAAQLDIDAGIRMEKTRTDAHVATLADIDVRRSQAETERSNAFDELIKTTKKLAFDELNMVAYKKALDKGENKCPYCPSKFDSAVTVLRDTHKAFEARFIASSDAQTATQAALAQAETARHMLDAERAACLSEYQRQSWATSNVQDAFRRKFAETSASMQVIEKRLVGAPTKGPNISVPTLQKEIQDLTAYVDAKAALVREGAKLRKAEKAQELFKRFEKTAVELQKDVMARVARRASDEVTQGMFGERTARLNSESCEWTVVGRDGEQHTWGAMCGTERTALRLALAAAWTRGSPLRLAIFDDEDMVGLSRKGLQDFYDTCQMLQQRGDFTQVIIVSNRPEVMPTNAGSWLTILCEPKTTLEDIEREQRVEVSEAVEVVQSQTAMRMPTGPTGLDAGV